MIVNAYTLGKVSVSLEDFVVFACQTCEPKKGATVTREICYVAASMYHMIWWSEEKFVLRYTSKYGAFMLKRCWLLFAYRYCL